MPATTTKRKKLPGIKVGIYLVGICIHIQCKCSSIHIGRQRSGNHHTTIKREKPRTISNMPGNPGTTYYMFERTHKSTSSIRAQCASYVWTGMHAHSFPDVALREDLPPHRAARAACFARVADSAIARGCTW